MFWVISVYFNIRNTLPKSGTFLLGHPVYTYVAFEAHVTVKWRNPLLSRAFRTIMHIVRLKAQWTAEGICDQIIVECTHYEYCDVLLAFRACKCRIVTKVRNYELWYPGRRHPDAYMFRKLEQDLCEKWSTKSTALVNARNLRTLQVTAKWTCHICSCGKRAGKLIKGEFSQKHNLFGTDGIFCNWNYMFRPLLAIFRFLQYWRGVYKFCKIYEGVLIKRSLYQLRDLYIN